MSQAKKKYVVDETGKAVSVLVDIEDYKALLKELEEPECLRSYDSAKASGEEAIPFEQALQEIEQKRL